ncbi:MAG: nuclear transport factor 2 family protein [SAR202 cluster bacterium]|nr:nuclear transport factor 2 family protein [SAR202 cluster bacterium]
MAAIDDVRNASKQFYAALNSMANGDAKPMSDIWAHSRDVTTMHPIGGRQVGWDQVRGPWEEVAKLASKGKIALNDQLIQVSGTLAYKTGNESGQFTFAGHQVSIGHRVTNVYRQDAGKWKIVHHHTDISPAMLDILREVQSKP